jgi:tetratricopeptide (TPR) repeat protein
MKRSRRFWLFASLITVGIIVLGGLGWYLIAGRTSTTPEDRRLVQLKEETLPDESEDKVTYYARIGSAYFDAGDYDQALDALLKADKNITDRTVEGGRSVNLTLGLTYAKLEDKAKAREYYQREIKRLQAANGSAEVIANIKKLEAEL